LDRGDTKSLKSLIEQDLLTLAQTARLLHSPFIEATLPLPSYTELVEALIATKSPSSVDLVDKKGRTPLMRAVSSATEDRAGLLAFINMLLDHGAAIDARDKQGNTPLHHAAKNWKFSDLVIPILERGSALKATNLEGKTPLDLAISNCFFTDAYQHLKARGATHGKTPHLYDAVYEGNVGQLEKLLAQEKREHNFYRIIRTAVMLAVTRGHLDIVKALTTTKYINCIDNSQFISILFRRAEKLNRVAIASYLANKEGVRLVHLPGSSVLDGLTRGSDVYNIVQLAGGKHIFPLHSAIRNRNKNTLADLAYFLGVGWDINPESGGETPLGAAIYCNQKKAADFLFEEGARLTSDLLTSAIKEGHPEMVKWVLDKDPTQINRPDDRAETPIYSLTDLIISEGKDDNPPSLVNIFNLLIAAGAEVNLKNHWHKTPLHVVAQLSVHEFIERAPGITTLMDLLLKKGAPIDAIDNDGKTPLDWAENGFPPYNLLREKGGLHAYEIRDSF